VLEATTLLLNMTSLRQDPRDGIDEIIKRYEEASEDPDNSTREG